MKIETGYVHSALLKNLNLSSQVDAFHKGQIFSGRVLSMHDKSLSIMTSDGTNIRAFLEGEVSIPLNVPLKFEVIESSKERVLISPIIQNSAEEGTREETLIGLAGSLGIDVNGESISYLNKEGFLFGRNLQRLMIGLEGDEGLLQRVKNVLITENKLVEYLKNFEGESGLKLIKSLSELFSEIKKGAANPRIYMGVMEDMIKGLSIQINHSYPLFYIPLPLLIDDKLYNGDIWIEKDKKSEKDDLNDITIYIFVDTSYLGRVEAEIRASSEGVGLNLFCSKEAVPLFNEDLNMLKERISLTGLNVKSINVSELTKKRSFTDLVQKYVKPFKPLDVRV